MPMPLSIVIGIACVLLGWEILLWRLFRRRIDPMIFPAESDASQLRFFDLGRMRFIAACHTVALGAAVLLPLLWLW